MKPHIFEEDLAKYESRPVLRMNDISKRVKFVFRDRAV
jgi:hypothetical protein